MTKMAKKQQYDEETGEMPEISTADLMAHARRVRQNVVDENYEAARQQAMIDFGLVEKKQSKQKEAPPAPPAAPVPPTPPAAPATPPVTQEGEGAPNPFADPT